MAAAPKKPRHKVDKTNEDSEARIADFLTERELGRLRATEARARERCYHRTKITVPPNLLPLRHLQEEWSAQQSYDEDDEFDEDDEDDIPTEDLPASTRFWNLYNLDTVTEIDARNSGITPADLRYVAQQCPQLTSLDIRSDLFRGVRSKDVVPILDQCRNLTTLRVTSIQDVAFTNLSQTCPKLTHLNLEWARLTDKGLRAIAHRCPNLTHLNLQFTLDRLDRPLLGEPLSDITHEGIIALARGCPKLTFLASGYLTAPFNVESLRALATGCPRLAHLDIYIPCDEDQDDLNEAIRQAYALFAQHLQQPLTVFFSRRSVVEHEEVDGRGPDKIRVINPTFIGVGASGGGESLKNFFPDLRF
jgi:hypothetical protein